MRWDFAQDCARDLMGRPDAHMAGIESLTHDRDGFDGFRVELADAPLTHTGPRKGLPNWSKSTNVQTRLISAAEVQAWIDAWHERTGQCVTCRGEGQVWCGWSKAEGTKWKPCPDCDAVPVKQEALFA